MERISCFNIIWHCFRVSRRLGDSGVLHSTQRRLCQPGRLLTASKPSLWLLRWLLQPLFKKCGNNEPMRTEIQVDWLSFLTSGQTDIQMFSTSFSLYAGPVIETMIQRRVAWAFSGAKNSELVDPQKLHLNISVCEVVHFSGTRAHNFYQIKIGTPWNKGFLTQKIENCNSQNQWPSKDLLIMLHI